MQYLMSIIGLTGGFNQEMKCSAMRVFTQQWECHLQEGQKVVEDVPECKNRVR